MSSVSITEYGERSMSKLIFLQSTSSPRTARSRPSPRSLQISRLPSPQLLLRFRPSSASRLRSSSHLLAARSSSPLPSSRRLSAASSAYVQIYSSTHKSYADILCCVAYLRGSRCCLERCWLCRHWLHHSSALLSWVRVPPVYLFRRRINPSCSEACGALVCATLTLTASICVGLDVAILAKISVVLAVIVKLNVNVLISVLGISL